MPSASRLIVSRIVSRASSVFFDAAVVARVVWDTYRHFDAHPARDVVPVLVQDAARDRLRVMPAMLRSGRRGAAHRDG